MSFTLCLFADADIPKVLQEIRRVLVPNGRLGIVAMDGNGTGLIVKSYRWMHRFFPRFVEKCGRPINVVTILENSGFNIRQQFKLRIGSLPIVAVVGTK
jgi:ubiquinone/menaquinone biosynthesis C-methylase UbiE